MQELEKTHDRQTERLRLRGRETMRIQAYEMYRKSGKVSKNIGKSMLPLKILRISCWVPGGQLN